MLPESIPAARSKPNGRSTVGCAKGSRPESTSCDSRSETPTFSGGAVKRCWRCASSGWSLMSSPVYRRFSRRRSWEAFPSRTGALRRRLVPYVSRSRTSFVKDVPYVAGAACDSSRFSIIASCPIKFPAVIGDYFPPSTVSGGIVNEFYDQRTVYVCSPVLDCEVSALARVTSTFGRRTL